MKNRWKRVCAGLVSAALLTSLVQANALSETAITANGTSFESTIERGYANPEMEYRPEIRWWVAEGAQTDGTLIEAIDDLYNAGFGSIEFVTLNEASLDPDQYGWGSDAWIHTSHLIVKECTKRGMGVSFTSGTNWGTANLTSISADDPAAFQEIGYKVIDLKPGETFDGNLPVVALPNGTTKMNLVSVVATQITNAESDLTSLLIDEENSEITQTVVVNSDASGYEDAWSLQYTAPNGDQDTRIFCFYQYGTANTNSPAKGTAYTINYFSQDGVDALKEYWDETVLTQDLQDAIDENGDVQIFMDSLEYGLSGADKVGIPWTAEFLDEFKIRRGYDLAPYLPLVVETANNQGLAWIKYFYELDGDALKTQKILNDVYQTLTDLYTDECLKPLAEWLHTKNMTVRAQNSYGQLLEINDPIQAVDWVETESLALGSEIDSYRNQAGGAHLFGKTYSSETGAVKFGLYNKSYDFYMQTFFTQFASGIQRTVLHGFSTDSGTVGNTKWPGFEGMGENFSARFNKRQPTWQDYPDTNQFLSRTQKALRQGTSKMDLAILRTDYFFDHRMLYQRTPVATPVHNNTRDADRQSLVTGNAKYWQDTTLQDHGYTYDYLSPNLLNHEDVSCTNGQIQENGVGYQAVLLYQEMLPYESAQTLYQWASESGLPVVIVDGESTEQQRIQYQVTHEGAALHTTFNDGNDNALAVVMAELKKLPTVRTVASVEDAYDALVDLGVPPRVEYKEANQQLLTAYRHAQQGDHDSILTDLPAVAAADYVYVYNYQDGLYQPAEDFDDEIIVDGIFTPYELNCWTGEVTELGDYSYTEDGRTVIPVSLKGGETAMYVLNPEQGEHVTNSNTKVVRKDGQLSFVASQTGTYTAELSNGTTVSKEIEVPQTVVLDDWSLVVESFTKGEKLQKTELCGDGLIKTEDYYTTNKTNIEVGKTDLVPWKEIPEVGDGVSGVGYYTTKIHIPSPLTADETVTLKLDSFCGGTAAVFVDGVKAESVNLQNPEVDITKLLNKQQENADYEITVRVATTLGNACLELANNAQPGDEDYGRFSWMEIVANGADVLCADQGDDVTAEYGLVGDASLVTYRTVPIVSSQADKTILGKVLAYAEAQYADPDFSNVILDVQTTFVNALQNARAVNASAAADQDEVDKAWQTLMTEIHKLGFVRGDKMTLGQLITIADEYNAVIDRYTPGTAQPFVTALNASKETYNDGNAMQEDVAQAESKLLDSMMALRYRADKAVLDAVLKDAASIDVSLHTAESTAVFNAAKEAAETVNSDLDATQFEVDEAAKILRNAIDGLQAVNASGATEIQGDGSVTNRSNNAKTGESAPIAAAASFSILAGVVLILRKKKY